MPEINTGGRRADGAPSASHWAKNIIAALIVSLSGLFSLIIYFSNSLVSLLFKIVFFKLRTIPFPHICQFCLNRERGTSKHTRTSTQTEIRWAMCVIRKEQMSRINSRPGQSIERKRNSETMSPFRLVQNYIFVITEKVKYQKSYRLVLNSR